MRMRLNNFLDATILNPAANRNDYLKLCEDAIKFQFPAVCLPTFMIESCKEMLQNSNVGLATVIGFPAGYQTMAVKIFELKDAIHRGANEIDYVIHRGYLAENMWEKLEEEAFMFIEICKQYSVLSKWIIESSEQNREQIIKLLHIANKVRPDYVKTSTGVYGKARLEDVKLFKDILLPEIKIKAAGGISDKAIAEAYIHAGATRLGVSQYVSLIS